MLKKIKNKKFLISIVIFIIVIFSLGIPYKDWWFAGCDDYHNLFLGYKSQNIKDILYFFYEGHSNQFNGDPNIPQIYKRTSFLSTYYRPLYCIYSSLLYKLFNTNIYYYLLISVFFHAINTVLLFNIFLFFINYYCAFLASLLFAFHPQIAYRFGAIANLHYYINVFLMLLIFLFFKKYLDSKKIVYNIFACFLFLLSLFTRESSIVLPGIIFLGSLLYTKIQKLNLKNIFINIKINLGLFLITISFLLLRLYLYPLNLANNSNNNINTNISLIKKLIFKFPQFQVFIYDFLWLSWLPWGQRLAKFFILSFILLLIIFLFIKNSKKFYVLFFMFSGLLMLWPALMGPYSPRYFYESCPFILLFFIFLFKDFKYYKETFFNKFKKLFLFFLSLFITFLIIFNIHSFCKREEKLKITKYAILDLIKNPEIKNKSLYFICYPFEGFDGLSSRTFWIYLNNPNYKVYFDKNTAITQVNSHIIKPTKFINIISEYYNQNYFNILPIKNGLNITNLNPEKISFFSEKTNLNIALDKKILPTNILFLYFDYTTKKFKFIKPDF